MLRNKRVRTITRAALLLLSIAFPATGSAAQDGCVPPGATTAQVRALPGLPGSGVVDSFAFVDGMPVVVVDGDAWGQEPDTCRWVFLMNMYDPSYFTDTFFRKGVRWYRRLESGGSLPVANEFADDFNTGSTVVDLIAHDASRYTSFVLLSPAAPTVPEYNALRDCILAGKCDFLDNRIDFDPEAGRGASPSLRFYAVAPSEDMVTSKSLVERGLFFFRKGDTVRFSGWYRAEGALPFTLLDFETSGIVHRPGIRITLRSGALGAELKWLDKPRYLQRPGAEVLFPVDRWVHVAVEVLFSEDEFGKIDIWQDGTHLLSSRGRTLPTADSVIDFLQVGITATPNEAVLHVDDIRVTPFLLSPSPPRAFP